MTTSITRRVIAAAAGGALALGALAAVPAAQAAPGKAKAPQSQSGAHGQAKALAQQVRALVVLLNKTATRYDARAAELDALAATLPEDQRDAAVTGAATLRQLADDSRALAAQVPTASSKAAVANYRKARVAIVKQAGPVLGLLKELRADASA